MKEIIITTCLLFSSIILYATEPVIIKDNKAEKSYTNMFYPAADYTGKNIYQIWGYYLEASPGFSSIKSNNLSSDIWKTESKLGYNFNVGYFYSISPTIKFKAGIGFSGYSFGLKGNGEISSTALKDIDNDTYIESLTLSNVNYTINPMYLSIPLTIELGNPNINKIGYYVDLGIEYSLLINENNSASGTYTTKGTYPQWGVTLADIPELGFYTERNIEPGKYLKKSNYSVKGGAGITIPLSGVVIFKLGLTGYLGLKDIGKKQVNNSDTGPISNQAYEFRSQYINNPMSSSGGSKTFYTGIEFGFYISKHVK